MLLRGSFPRVFMLALALTLAMRISLPHSGGGGKLSAAQSAPPPFLGKVLDRFFGRASSLVLESTGLLERTVKKRVGFVEGRWKAVAEKVGGELSSLAAGMSRVFYKSSPLYGLKAWGDKACDGILDLLGRSLVWASWGDLIPGAKAPSPAGVSLPRGGTPVPSGAPGPGRE